MSIKVTVLQVAEILKKHREITPTVLREVVEELNSVVQPEENDEPTPRQKTQYVVITNTDSSLGWIVQLPESSSPHSVLDRVNQAAHDFNASKKGKLLPCKTIGEAFESVSRKWFKNVELSVKTKLPIYLIRTDNRLTDPPSA